MKQMDKYDIIYKIKEILWRNGTTDENGVLTLDNDESEIDHAAEEIADFIMEETQKTTTKKVYGIHVCRRIDGDEYNRIEKLFADKEQAKKEISDYINREAKAAKDWIDDGGTWERTETDFYASPDDGFGEYVEVNLEEFDVVE